MEIKLDFNKSILEKWEIFLEVLMQIGQKDKKQNF